MAEFDRLSGGIEWIDLEFVEGGADTRADR
jgi:hypothetical protein